MFSSDFLCTEQGSLTLNKSCFCLDYVLQDPGLPSKGRGVAQDKPAKEEKTEPLFFPKSFLVVNMNQQLIIWMVITK
jgi:hypothetical protein